MGVIKRQGIKNTITTYIGIIIGFISLMIIQPHFLTKEELGLTRILFSFSILAALFVPMGIGNATVKFFPQFKNDAKGHHGFLPFILIFPLIGYIITCGLIFLLKDFILNQYRKESPLFVDYFPYVFPFIFLLAFIALLTTYCFSNYKSTIPAFINDILVRLLTIGVVTIYYLKLLTFQQFVVCFIGIYAVQLLLLIIYIGYFDKIVFKINWSYFKEQKFLSMLSYSALFWLSGIASISLKYVDSIMVGKFMPLGYVAIYTIAAFVPTVIEAPLNALEKIANSKIAFAWAANNKSEIYTIYHKSSLYLLLAGGFLFLNININVTNLFGLLPNDYSAGRYVILIISIGTLFNMATGLNSPILFTSGKYRFGVLFLFMLAIMLIPLQMFFIPRFGLEGAAIATSLAALIYNTMMTVTVWKYFRLQPFDKKNLRILALIIGCFGINFLIPGIDNKIADLIVRSSVISIIYLVVVYLLNVVPEFHQYIPLLKKNK